MFNASLKQKNADNVTDQQVEFVRIALKRHRQEGIRLAVRARILAIAAIMVFMPFVNPTWSVLYYEAMALMLMAVGYVQLKLADNDNVWVEVALFSVDFALLTLIMIGPHPYADFDIPHAAIFRAVEFGYFFLYLALGTLAYSWQAIRIVAILGALIWLIGVVSVAALSEPHPSSDAVRAALEPYPMLSFLLDPESVRFDIRIREVVVFALVAFVLSVTVRRFGDLLLTHVAVDRQRTNLSRYFSPNLIDELSANDDPLRAIRIQDAAVMFVDIVSFTAYTDKQSPELVIQTLRDFHSRMEQAIFDNHGTVDQFLGDGVKATFGTPTPGKTDALNALGCARAMIAAVEDWNTERAARDEERLEIGIGIHFGPCVVGDIGGKNRLEFAVTGGTVNIASRVEAKTRELQVGILLTTDFANRVRIEAGASTDPLLDFTEFPSQHIRGVSDPVTLLGR